MSGFNARVARRMVQLEKGVVEKTTPFVFYLLVFQPLPDLQRTPITLSFAKPVVHI
jgi:hypothetical protein